MYHSFHSLNQLLCVWYHKVFFAKFQLDNLYVFLHKNFELDECTNHFVLQYFVGYNSVKSEDIAIYLRWLVTSLHCIRKFSSFLRILQWIPVIHRNSIDPTLGTQLKPVGEVSYFLLCI